MTLLFSEAGLFNKLIDVGCCSTTYLTSFLITISASTDSSAVFFFFGQSIAVTEITTFSVCKSYVASLLLQVFYSALRSFCLKTETNVQIMIKPNLVCGSYIHFASCTGLSTFVHIWSRPFPHFQESV